MKVLLTGASGFVGSHILDELRARQISVVVLLRPSSSKRFIIKHLADVEVRNGSVSDGPSLVRAMGEISHVIHCAGCTKARKNSEFYEINQMGTRNVVEAVNSHSADVRRLVLISSLAVSGPGTPEKPARESDSSNPISEYGRSKLGAEREVREHCSVPYVILRPPAVYGPRDYAFFPMFKAIKRHILPQPSAHQFLSIVYVRDLAEAVVDCLDHPAAQGNTYFVSSREVVTGGRMAREIAVQMGAWTVPLPLPALVLWPVCLAQEIASRLTGKPMLLNLQKFAELRASGWVCDASKLKAEIGRECGTSLRAGVTATLGWYRKNGLI